MMENGSKPEVIHYHYSYTTQGGAHRFKPAPNKRRKMDLGDVYLRGVDKPPHHIKVTVETIS